MSEPPLRPADLADWLIGRGKHFITTDELSGLLGVEPADVRNSLRRPRQAEELVAVTKGGWVPVPAEYRAAGGPPPLHYVDPLMKHLGHPYYVGFLSAAALYGASHQSPMVFQVVTTALLRNRTIGSGRIRFIRRGATERRSTEQRTVPTGRVTLSTVEVTVLDLVEAPRFGGGLSNVATVIGDLLADGLVDPAALVDEAREYPLAVAQRAGHLIERLAGQVGVVIDLDALAALVDGAELVQLASRGGRSGRRDERWRLILNRDVEADV